MICGCAWRHIGEGQVILGTMILIDAWHAQHQVRVAQELFPQ